MVNVIVELLKGESKINMEEKTKSKMCATTDTVTCWEEIDFKKAEQSVKKLQRRIAEAYREKRYDVVMNLQHKLIHSFYAKALAVKRVSSINKGKYTPGIDNEIWNTSQLKFEAIASLNRRGYKMKPLKRIYIPKRNGGVRPLSIPTMQDRAMQTLYKFALEPIAEVTADSSSYAYRPKRSCKNAIAQCCELLSKNKSIEWIMKLDIKSCFDNISHEWLLNHIFTDKVMLHKIITTPYMKDLTLQQTTNGVPQGGPLSSVLCNMTLDGLEELLSKQFGNDVHMIRYADDILILGNLKPFLVHSVAPVIEEFLTERNLALSDQKTKIFHTDNCFNFLGWNIYREQDKIISIPTRASIERLLARIEHILSNDMCLTQKVQIKKVSSVVRGWFNYYIGLAQEQSLYGVEFEVLSLLHNKGLDQCAGMIKQIIIKIFQAYER